VRPDDHMVWEYVPELDCYQIMETIPTPNRRANPGHTFKLLVEVHGFLVIDESDVAYHQRLCNQHYKDQVLACQKANHGHV